jgi:gas vesicle protein
MNRFANFLIGAVIGAAVGAGIAIMLAPMSGQELQDQIRSRANNIQIEVERAASEKRAELEAQLAHLRAQAE